ncbi:MAG: hypothetical protein LBE91_06375 [Tannerella sp.]|jgi:hypothetical protein|nr:hypothetical protein [Tannerella sp.]
MNILEGLLFINNTDVWLQFGAFLSEDNANEHRNYSELMKPAAVKPYVSVAFREDDGEELPANLLTRSEARDVTLQFAIIADNAVQFKQRYTAFMAFLKSGWLDVEVPELDEMFRFYFVSCSGYEQLSPPLPPQGGVAASFSIKFREPGPFV